MRFGLILLILSTAHSTLLAQSRRSGTARESAAVSAFPSLEAAISAAKSDDPKQQIAAARWMSASKTDPAAAIPALLPMLDNASLQRELQMHVVRESPATAAAQAIYAMLPAAIEPLIAALDNPSPVIRSNILHLLHGLGENPKVTRAFLSCIGDRDASVRGSAAIGLARANTVEATEALLKRLSDDDKRVRATAAHAIGYAAAQRTPGKPISNYLQAAVVKRLGELLKDPEKNVKVNAADALGRLHSGNGTDALAAAVDDPDIRGVVVQSLGQIGNSRGTMAVVRVLKLPADSENATARVLAAQALGKLVDVRAVTPLLEALKDKDENVRRWAADSLGLIGDRRAVQPLIQVLQDKSAMNQQVRAAAARSLGRIGDGRAVEPLIAALSDKTASREAIRALGSLRDPAAIEPLARHLFEEKTEDQEAAVWAIAQIRDPRAIKALVEGAIRSKDTGLVHIVRRTLDRLLDTSFVFDGEQPAKWWAQHKSEYETE